MLSALTKLIPLNETKGAREPQRLYPTPQSSAALRSGQSSPSCAGLLFFFFFLKLTSPLPLLLSVFFSCCFTVCLSISLKKITMESHSGRAGRGFRNHRVQSLYLRGEDARAQKEEVSGCNNFPLYSPPLPPGYSPFVRNLGLVMHPEVPAVLSDDQLRSPGGESWPMAIHFELPGQSFPLSLCFLLKDSPC